jgi:hypothetical protein
VLSFKNFAFDTDITSELISIKISGIAPPHKLAQSLTTTLLKAHSHQKRKLLFDVQNFDINHYDSYELLQVFKLTSPRMKSLKIAHVISEESHKHMLIEQMAEFNNIELKNFNCGEQALTWLDEK